MRGKGEIDSQSVKRKPHVREGVVFDLTDHAESAIRKGVNESNRVIASQTVWLFPFTSGGIFMKAVADKAVDRLFRLRRWG